MPPVAGLGGLEQELRRRRDPAANHDRVRREQRRERRQPQAKPRSRLRQRGYGRFGARARTAPEIADELDLPLNTVYSRLRVARERFTAAVCRLRGKEGER